MQPTETHKDPIEPDNVPPKARTKKQKEPSFVNRTRLNDANYGEFLQSVTKHGSKMGVITWSIIAMGLGIMNLVSYFQHADTPIVYLILATAFILLGIFIPIMMLRIVPKKQAAIFTQEDQKIQGRKDPFRRYSFYADAVDIEVGEVEQTTVPYESMQKVIESKNLLILIPDNQVAYIVKKSGFQKGNWKQLHSFLSKKIQERESQQAPQQGNFFSKEK